MENENFHTPKGYQQEREDELTESMEDYLEMICRLAKKEQFARINFLAKQLHVKPSSSSKMVANLKMMGYVDFEPYGVVRPTKKGWQVGEFLLHRHVVLDEFFHLLNHSDHHLKLVEQIEHYIDRETLDNLEELTKKMMKEI